MHLEGAEAVSRAGHNMASAAVTISNAASTISDTVYRLENALQNHEAFLLSWLERMEKLFRPEAT